MRATRVLVACSSKALQLRGGMPGLDDSEPVPKRPRGEGDGSQHPEARGSGDAAPEQVEPHAAEEAVARQPELHQVTGVPDIDNLRFGSPIGRIGLLVAYKSPTIVSVGPKHPTVEMDTILNFLAEHEFDGRSQRRTQHLFFLYTGTADLQAVHQRIEENTRHTKSVFCIGTVNNTTSLVYIFKYDARGLPNEWSIGEDTPHFYGIRNNGGKVTDLTARILEKLESAMVQIKTNIRLLKPSREGALAYSFELVQELTHRMSDAELHHLRGSAMSVPFKDRSTWQHTFLRCFSDMKQIRDLRFKSSTLIWNAYDPPFQIIKTDKLKNLDQIGHRLHEQTHTLLVWHLVSV